MEDTDGRPKPSPRGVTEQDPAALAESAGLAHVADDIPGILRTRRGRGWSFRRSNGSLVRDRGERTRIAALAIPPAWTDVWISPDPSSHLQATGRDERGRKQYRYHAAWDEVRSAAKFDRLVEFGRALPRIRAHVSRALAAPSLDREKVLAAVVALLDLTAIRVGNDEYARENRTYGLATLRDRHVQVRGATIELRFEAKGGKETKMTIRNERIARVVEECAAIPGYEVFKWIARDGQKRDVKAEDVNAFIREASGGDFTAKDFRTWLGTLRAYRHLASCASPSDSADAEARCLEAADAAAELLGNTREVARSSYVHTDLLDLYRAGKLPRSSRGGRGRRSGRLFADERALLSLLDRMQQVA